MAPGLETAAALRRAKSRIGDDGCRLPAGRRQLQTKQIPAGPQVRELVAINNAGQIVGQDAGSAAEAFCIRAVP
jgi:hypothetical protein